MKGKWLTLVLLMLLMASGAWAATRTTAYTASRALTPPVMNGVMTPGEWQGEPFGGGKIDKAWMDQHGQYGRVIWRVLGWAGVTDDEDFSCYVYMMWDTTKLYFAIDATASGPNFLGGPFAGETVQMIVDPTGTGGTNQWSINVSNNGGLGSNNSYGSCSPPTSGISVGYAEKDGGYVMEFSIPLAGGTPAIPATEGTTIGLLLAFIIIDSDDLGPFADHWDDIWLLGGPDPTVEPNPVPNPFEQPGPLCPITLGPPAPVRTTAMVATKAAHPPVLDGVMEPGEWQGAPFGGGLIGQEWMTSHGQFGRTIWRVGDWVGVTDDTDFSTYVYIMWDNTNLYFCVDATASGPNFVGGPFAGETVQMIVDPTGTGGTNQWSINVANNGGFGANNSYGSCSPPTSGIAVGYAEKEGGYVMEFSIPLAGGTPAIPPTEGNTIGLLLAFVIVDSDDTGPFADHWDDIWLLGGPYPTVEPTPVPNPFEQPGPLSPITFGPPIEVVNENVITTDPRGPWYIAGQLLTMQVPSAYTNYTWYKNSAPIEDDGRITGNGTEAITFDTLLESDSGSYTCTFDDGTGKAVISTPVFELDVLPEDTTLPVAGLFGLGALVAALCAGSIALRKRM